MATPGTLAPLGDNFHNGVNNGGNKSFVAYRVGYGIPGCTYFIPVSENIPVPTKRGIATRATLHDLSLDSKHGDGGTIAKEASTHKADFGLTPDEFATATQPNKLWDLKSSRPIGDPPFIRRPAPETEPQRDFTASSTFQETFCKSNQVAPQAYPETVTHLGQLRPASSTHGAERDGKRNPFMTTEYSHKSEQVHRALKHAAPAPPPPPQRANADTIPSVTLKEPTLVTSYRNDYGPFGVDPVSKMPEVPAEICMRASTAEYNMGTTKSGKHPPGYSGFIPATFRNAKATAQGKCAVPREGTKKFELSTLFQYPQDIPGYAGYRPRTTINDVGPNRNIELTTTGRFYNKGTCGFQPGDLGLAVSVCAETAPQPSAHAKKSSIRQDLFSHESATGAISDNGQHDAECYFGKVRPMEGRSVAIIKQGHWSQAY